MPAWPTPTPPRPSPWARRDRPGPPRSRATTRSASPPTTACCPRRASPATASSDQELRMSTASLSARPFGALRARTGEPAWVRPALLGLLAAAAFMYLYKLTASAYSNAYYAAAVKSASVSAKAWFFGSLDPGSFITVDKPPLAIWLMGLSARVFGFSSFSLLLPQALCTLATVGLLFATVRRPFGPVAGLLAAAMLVLSPVTLALARVDMPAPLLVLLLVASAWATLRAVESGRTRDLLWAGAFVGLAFMTKMLQGWMVVPALFTTS